MDHLQIRLMRSISGSEALNYASYSGWFVATLRSRGRSSGLGSFCTLPRGATISSLHKSLPVTRRQSGSGAAGSLRTACLASETHHALVARGIVTTISRATISRWLSAADIKPHRLRYWLNSKDPEFKAKRDRVVSL